MIAVIGAARDNPRIFRSGTRMLLCGRRLSCNPHCWICRHSTPEGVTIYPNASITAGSTPSILRVRRVARFSNYRRLHCPMGVVAGIDSAGAASVINQHCSGGSRFPSTAVPSACLGRKQFQSLRSLQFCRYPLALFPHGGISHQVSPSRCRHLRHQFSRFFWDNLLRYVSAIPFVVG